MDELLQKITEDMELLDDSSEESMLSNMSDDDQNTFDEHDEVEAILEHTGPEIMEIFASDPEHYLNIVQNYKKTRNGEDIYLSNLCNIIIERLGGRLRIKFKLSDHTNWHEVGFDGGEFTDEDVYAAFSEKVYEALKRPLDYHRRMIDDIQTNDDTLEKTTTPKNEEIKNQNTVSKLDKFKGVKVETPKIDFTKPFDPSPLKNVVTAKPVEHTPVMNGGPFNLKSNDLLLNLSLLRGSCPQNKQQKLNNTINALEKYYNNTNSFEHKVIRLFGQADSNVVELLKGLLF